MNKDNARDKSRKGGRKYYFFSAKIRQKFKYPFTYMCVCVS